MRNSNSSQNGAALGYTVQPIINTLYSNITRMANLQFVPNWFLTPNMVITRMMMVRRMDRNWLLCCILKYSIMTPMRLPITLKPLSILAQSMTKNMKTAWVMAFINTILVGQLYSTMIIVSSIMMDRMLLHGMLNCFQQTMMYIRNRSVIPQSMLITDVMPQEANWILLCSVNVSTSYDVQNIKCRFFWRWYRFMGFDYSIINRLVRTFRVTDSLRLTLRLLGSNNCNISEQVKDLQLLIDRADSTGLFIEMYDLLWMSAGTVKH